MRRSNTVFRCDVIKVVDALFSSRKGSRLVLHGPEEKDSGGWTKRSMVDFICRQFGIGAAAQRDLRPGELP